MNKITFLGSAGDFDVIKTGRSAGGIFIEVDDHNILLDPGPGSVTVAGHLKIDLSKTDIVFISGPGLLNANDINAVAELGSPTLLCHKELLKHEESCLTMDHAKKFNIIPVEDSSTHKVKDINITVIKNKKKEFSFIITTSKYIIGYVSDTAIYKKTIKEFSDCNILVIRCFDTDKQNVYELIKDVNPELVILTGYDAAMLKENPLEFSRSLKRALSAANAGNIQVIPAHDGTIINPESYNIRLKQKSLDEF